ncbi:hypothetical protein AB3G45_17275 [Shinella sp. S4-D37]|uniref:hypothetical protein n=1 Tax=Shinella sp. S4-D37 TaxID=3161999 RepID=UPI0034670617
MAGINEFRTYTNTPKRRNTFYNYCTTRFIQDQAIFFLLVEAFHESRSKRQAAFLNDWFIQGNIPQDLSETGYIGIVNISSDLQKTISANTNNAISAVGRTFSAKMTNHGGGVGGFFGALRQKMGETTVTADLFNTAQSQVVTMLDDGGRHGFGGVGGVGATYNSNGAYQPLGSFSALVVHFRKELKAGGFEPDKVGIY